jgi:hypothetical protein
MLPVMFPTNIDTTSNTNEVNKRNRINRFSIRAESPSDFLGAVSSLVSPNVTKTAAATKAAGAPILPWLRVERGLENE